MIILKFLISIKINTLTRLNVRGINFRDVWPNSRKYDSAKSLEVIESRK